MRIVAGHLRGRIIPSHRSLGTVRLTASRVKEAAFSMLGADLSGLKFLDLCAGSGQVGLEACSRGARTMLNEPDRRRCLQIRRLLSRWEVDGVEVRTTRAEMLIPRLHQEGRKFDTVYVDPPYRARRGHESLAGALLEQLGSANILRPGAQVLVQHQADLTLPAQAGALHQRDVRLYGNTALSIYQKGRKRDMS